MSETSKSNNKISSNEPEVAAADDQGSIDSGDQKSLPPTYGDDIRELVDSDDGKRPVNVRVEVRQGESVEQMLRRFNFAVNKADIIKKLKDRQFYEKPSKRRQREEKLRKQQVRKYS